jgi:hypothetical protein
MEKKNYLIVVDTTDAKTRVNLPRGLLNTYVVLALDPIHAKKVLLSMFPRSMADQLADALYVYDLEQVTTTLKAVDEQKQLPLFSFMPLSGGRPPKQSDVQLTQSGNQTLTPNTTTSAQIPPQQPPRSQTPFRGQRGGRSLEFQQTEEGNNPPTTNVLTKEQADLVNRFGITQAREGNDEGVNLRINSSTGVNQNLTPQKRTLDTPSDVTTEQAEILSRLNVRHPEPVTDNELLREIAESGGASSLVDDSLTTINETPLDDDTINRLKSE